MRRLTNTGHKRISRYKGTGGETTYLYVAVGTSAHSKGEKTSKTSKNFPDTPQGLIDAIAWRDAALAGLTPAQAASNGFAAYVGRLRYDDNDLGPVDHARSAAVVAGSHRRALERLGPVVGEFKPDGVGYEELLLAVAKELARRWRGAPELGIVLESAPDPDFVDFASSHGVIAQQYRAESGLDTYVGAEVLA
jgi:hypothetical protein